MEKENTVPNNILDCSSKQFLNFVWRYFLNEMSKYLTDNDKKCKACNGHETKKIRRIMHFIK